MIWFFLWGKKLRRRILSCALQHADLRFPSTLPGIARDIGLQLVNRGALSGNGPIDEIANGNEADNAVVIKNGQMANPMSGHQPHAFFDGVGGGDLNDLAGEDFFDRGVPGRFALEHNFAGVIALGDDADQFVSLENEQRPDVLVRHELKGLEDGGVGGDRPNVGALAEALMVKDFTDSSGWMHG
ncbi:hypothetical protein SBV1_120015 [Verrucomicrobia bacterium]|nr:hypothetical protein SBV1_120015 [Verrucomicrobiota bacterium]